MLKVVPRVITTVAMLLFAWINACKPASPSKTPGNQPASSPQSPSLLTATPSAGTTWLPTITPSPSPPRSLTICLFNEPQSLFLYGDGSQEARLVRQALYDGPYDLLGTDFIPVILARQPSLQNGDIRFEPTTASPGDLIVASDGILTNLAEGVSYSPPGCRAPDCALVYQGDAPIQLEQLSVRFRLLQGIRWSDGSSLTADDSVFSYEVARALFPRARADLLAHTQSYQALDSYTLEWRGVPGYRSSQVATFFFDPLPRSAWGGLTREELLTSEMTTRRPLGWGAYLIENWVTGEAIYLTRNPFYFRAAEGLPKFDSLVLRFVPDQAHALQELKSGGCDILDEQSFFDYQRQVGSNGPLPGADNVAVLFKEDTAWEHLDFGLLPIDASTTPSLLLQKEVRQALARCIDRQKIIIELFGESLPVPNSYLSPSHPLLNPDLPLYPFDPSAASHALETAGWLDTDNDPATPRLSQGVPGLSDGTPFTLTLLVAQDQASLASAGIIQQSLAQCGVQVQVEAHTWQELLAAGPDGPIFGRRFQLAQYAWASSPEPACFLYTSGEIPGPYPDYARGWGGANASGFRSPEFDRLCALALSSLPEEAQYTQAHHQAQALFAESLPALPLYMHRRVILARPDLCGLTPNASASSSFWNLESLDYGEACR